MNPLSHSCGRHEPILSRRDFLKRTGAGFGMLGLANLLSHEAFSSGALAAAPASPLALKPPMFPAKAKRVIFLFMPGGPPGMDTFDPKPLLTRDNGKPLPFEKPKLERSKTGNLFATNFQFKKHGQAGTEVSELFPHVAGCVDDLCVIRSCVADNINHGGARLQMTTGEQTFSRPSMGAWLTYGLGSVNQNLPGFVVLAPNPPGGGKEWGSAFLPASHQATLVTDFANPIANLANARIDRETQREQLDALAELNKLHAAQREDDSRLAARIESFELAYRMQSEAPEAFDISRESAATRQLYGIGSELTDTFGKQCLLARRLVERGVRMVQLYHTQAGKRRDSNLWDQHGNLIRDLPENCAASDQPIAGLLRDLKSRGLLQDTLVVWGGEFGRTPTVQGKDGREHNPFGFTMWLAGGGVKPGLAYGTTDDYGWHAQENRVHVHDLHATMLHLMGIDHEKLTYRYSGRNFRLTDVYGNVVNDILA